MLPKENYHFPSSFSFKIISSRFKMFLSKGVCIFSIILILVHTAQAKKVNKTKTRFHRKLEILKDELDGVQSVNLTTAVKDIVHGLPTSHVTLLFDSLLDIKFPEKLIKLLHTEGVTTKMYIIDTEESQEKFCKYTKATLARNEESINIIFSTRKSFMNLMWMAHNEDIIHRRILFIFYWGHQMVKKELAVNFAEAMRIAVISNPRPGTYRIYYSQATPSGTNRLKLVNWWSTLSGLFRNPVLPASNKVYRDFKGRIFEVPVLHKPPWNFVEYNNDSILVDGGRDDKLLAVLAEKLNFDYEYFDPPERNQGSAITKNGTFPGVLGLVWKREADFFLGDVTITFERSQAVEFSFLTLADSEAFVTHKPSKLNEALALIRPFQLQVWPFIALLFALYGPIIFAIIEAPTLWKRSARSGKARWRLMGDCMWFSTATFLRQGSKQPGKSHKARLVFVLVTLAATYVIGDMYSANLTSLLARPGRERPITTLEQLEKAMNFRSYQLLVERHSSSYSILQNGTEIYDRLWANMQKQKTNVIDSVEIGMKLVRDKRNFAFLGGRETLFFDTKRFGAYNFHLSEKLNTRYSAIAMQIGSPFIENFNQILMQLFEGGILIKMTEEEYERLGEKQRAAAGAGSTDEEIAAAKEEIEKHGETSDVKGEQQVLEGEASGQQTALDNEHQLQPLNIRMLQGAFYMLLIGHLTSALVLIIEMNKKNLDKVKEKSICKKIKFFTVVSLRRNIKYAKHWIYMFVVRPLKENIMIEDVDTPLSQHKTVYLH